MLNHQLGSVTENPLNRDKCAYLSNSVHEVWNTNTKLLAFPVIKLRPLFM
jgi:hypothetical protein